jgi:endonuclease YncB( thermonuclease family)
MKLILVFLSCLIPSIALSDYLDCPCKVVKVTDGDTVNVLDQTRTQHKIRLGGIDAPERSQDFGRKSTENLAGYVAGEYIEVEYNKRDRYERIVGKLVKDGRDINLLQVKDGFAWHYKYYQRDQSASDRALYSAAENEARGKSIGLWSAPAVPPWEWRRKGSQQTSSTGCDIKGNISSNGNRIYHLSGTTWYSRTKINEAKGERWFCSEEEARAAGWRAPYN